jgi:hypothetical protein
MADDVLSLGGIVFDNFSPPREMMSGGNQAMVVHKLPGGSRVIDTLGPDEADIVWNGFFFGDTAYQTALALDAMRSAGQVLPLIWGGQFRSVILSNFIYKVRRMPVWVLYSVTCTVYQNPQNGNVQSSAPTSIDGLVSTDLSTAAGAASPEATALANGTAAL